MVQSYVASSGAIDKATIATQNFTYIPGAVTISAPEGYSASMTGSVKRLSAEGSGDVYAKDEAALCYNGTWKLVEVTDFTAQLAGLVKKCELIALNAKPGKVGEPTEEALEYLLNNVTTPAGAAVAEGGVTEQQLRELHIKIRGTGSEVQEKPEA